ncbi:MAG: rod shape-determining protein MreD [Clostridiaceae bacterium]|nr:rod shape-determining protein MreD [Clostridiaceae bacterium]
MKTSIIGLIIFINFILHSTLFQHIELKNVVPNTSLILVVCFAINSKKDKGAIIGFIIGLIQDVIFEKVIGLNALAYMLIGYIIGTTNRNIFKDNPIIPFVFTALATVFYYGISLLVIYLLGYSLEYFNILRFMLPFEIIYNSIISVFVYIYVSKIFKSIKNRY